MTRVTVLGGGGGVGRIVVKALAAVEDFDEVVAADMNMVAAREVSDALGPERVRPVRVDATDERSLRETIRGSDLVVGCIGPFYRFGAPVLEAAIDEGVSFVDICDDLDATLAELALDERARQAGVTAMIGMGNSPGLANVLVRYAADHLLGTVERVDIMHIHGGEPEEGGAVVRHRIHAMVKDVPLFIDGEMIQVRMLEPSGTAYVEETDFRDVGRFPVYPYPHPETITLPRHLPGVKRVTNRGVVFPLAYFDLTRTLTARALDEVVTTRSLSLEPDEPDGEDDLDIEPPGAGEHAAELAHEKVSEIVDAILAARPGLLADAGVTGPAGCLKIEVEGEKDGERHTYVFSLSSSAGGAGEGTGIPAALGALLIHRGEIEVPGVHPPEEVVDPVEMLALGGEVVKHFDMEAKTATGTVPIHIEHVTPGGGVEEMELAL